MQPVPLSKASRLLNHGPTVLVGSAHGGHINVMVGTSVAMLERHYRKLTATLAAGRLA